jgi:hypothetical protein
MCAWLICQIYVAVAVAAQGLILFVVLITTGRYISHFRNTDSQLTRRGVILGSALAWYVCFRIRSVDSATDDRSGAFGMQCFQVRLRVVSAHLPFR